MKNSTLRQYFLFAVFSSLIACDKNEPFQQSDTAPVKMEVVKFTPPWVVNYTGK
jgi:hypothetical protein